MTRFLFILRQRGGTCVLTSLFPEQIHAALGSSTSDMFKMLSVVGAYEYAGGGHAFCAEHFVRPKVRHALFPVPTRSSAG